MPRSDPLAPARGILAALALSVPLWGAVVAVWGALSW